MYKLSYLAFTLGIFVIRRPLKVVLGHSGFCVSLESLAAGRDCGDAIKQSIRMYSH